MQAVELRHELDGFAERNAWEHTAGRLRMSSLNAREEELIEWFFTGKPEPDEAGLREAYLGHVLAHDMQYRLDQLGLQVEDREREIVAPFDERCVGHIDGLLDGELLEVVTVREQRFDQILARRKLQDRKFVQIQTYLHFLGLENAKVIVYSRERGRVYVLHLRRQESVGRAMEKKARRVLAAVDAALADGRTVEEATEWEI